MSECLILNEASLPFESSAACETKLAEFFKILFKANSEGLHFYQSDATEGKWSTLNYTQGFELGRWINEIRQNELKLLVKSVLSNVTCPQFESGLYEIEETRLKSLYVLQSDQNIEVKGLGLASIIDAHGISFASHLNWEVTLVGIVKQWDEGGDVQKKNISVPNLYKLNCIDNLITAIRNRKQENRRYLLTLVVRNNKDFQRLIFCESALKDLRSASVSVDDYLNIIESLKRLNDSIGAAQNLNELIAASELDISGESKETMSIPKYERRRRFNHPDFGISVFEIHVKNFTGGKRMHIFPDYVQKTICIGYFGRHLPTVNHPK